jgi:hypothetical protein
LVAYLDELELGVNTFIARWQNILQRSSFNPKSCQYQIINA